MADTTKSLHGVFKNDKGNTIEVNTPLVSFKQGEIDVIYSPTLELYGYGKNIREAKKSFEVVLTEFINYGMNKGTFFKELERMGWKVLKKKRKFEAPSFSEMLTKNEKLSEIVNNTPFNVEHSTLPFPVS